jgi:hypothetical protein
MSTVEKWNGRDRFWIVMLLMSLLATACSTGWGQTAEQQQRIQQIQQQTQDIVQKSMEAQRQRLEVLKRGIVRVEVQEENDGQNLSQQAGTGIVVAASPERILILTAFHVVKTAKKINVVFYPDQSVRVPAMKLPNHSGSLDLALLEVKPSNTYKLPTNIEPYHFLSNNGLQVGLHLWSVNGDWIIVPNNLTRLSHDGDPQKFEYSNVSVGEGFSGGPIFDDYQDVIGMHDALIPDGAYAVAVKIDSALQVLEALGYSVPKASPTTMPFINTPPPNQAPEPVVPCQAGCIAKLSELKLSQQYSGLARGSCNEKVYQFPDSWPAKGLFMHVRQCTTMKGPYTMAGFGLTNREGDMDTMYGALLFSRYSAHGILTDDHQGHWDMKIDSATGQDFLDPSTTVTIKPFGR